MWTTIRSAPARPWKAHPAPRPPHRRPRGKAALTYAHMTDEWFNNELKVPLRHVRDMEKRVRQAP